MKNAILATVTLDNGLLIAIFGLVGGLLAYLIEREKTKKAVADAKKLEQTVNRLETLVTKLSNMLISRDDEDGGVVGDPPIIHPVIGPHDKTPKPDAPKDSGPPSLNPSPTNPLEIPGSTGKYIVWMSLDANSSPRYVLLTWDKTGIEIGYRVRDYLGGVMLHPPSAEFQGDPRLQSMQSTLTLDDLWSKARCHIKVKKKGVLDQEVKDFLWWHGRLSQLTKGHESGHALTQRGTGEVGIRNVLLMLSSLQDPPPRNEVHWHATNSAANGTTFLATTRVLTDMKKNQSIVAFYGDVNLFNQVLGYGVFVDYIRTESDEGRRRLEAIEHYNKHGIPDGVLGLIEMRDFQELPEGTCLESFHGTIESLGVGNGRRLTFLNLPEGAARAQVYYRKTAGPTSL